MSSRWSNNSCVTFRCNFLEIHHDISPKCEQEKLEEQKINDGRENRISSHLQSNRPETLLLEEIFQNESIHLLDRMDDRFFHSHTLATTSLTLTLMTHGWEEDPVNIKSILNEIYNVKIRLWGFAAVQVIMFPLCYPLSGGFSSLLFSDDILCVSPGQNQQSVESIFHKLKVI